MYKLITALILLLLFGCQSESEIKVELANRYWESLAQKDNFVFDELSLKTKNITLNSSLEFDGPLPVIKGIDENGVITSFSQDCYPEIIFSTFISQTENNEYKVDHMKTQKAFFSAVKKVKTNRKYCFEFKDIPMTGLVGGKPWQPHLMKKIDWLGKPAHAILPQDCEDISGELCSKIYLFRLDIDSEGGNFVDDTLITLYFHPNKNMSGLGSFKLTQLNEKELKIEITFHYDDNNYIEGYFIANKKLL